jgi:RNA polymerase sigma-70 factor (ECF subfamily)
MGALQTEELYRRLGDDLRAFLRRRLPDDATTDDVLHDVFVRVHDRIEQLRQDDRVAGWVFQIARNAVHDHYRRSRVRRHESIPDEIAQDEPDDPERLAPLAAWLGAAVETLPAPYAEALRLVELEGLTQREAAERTRGALGLLRRRSRRARRGDRLPTPYRRLRLPELLSPPTSEPARRDTNLRPAPRRGPNTDPRDALHSPVPYRCCR